jgi:hypothetical protein
MTANLENQFLHIVAWQAYQSQFFGQVFLKSQTNH